MTGYFVTLKSATGKEFTRCLDSALGRELFVIAALSYGASVLKEWVGHIPTAEIVQ